MNWRYKLFVVSQWIAVKFVTGLAWSAWICRALSTKERDQFVFAAKLFSELRKEDKVKEMKFE